MIAYMRVSIEAMQLKPCDIFIDTIGVSMAYPIIKLLFPCCIVSYTHYPTISSDMLSQINTNQFNNKVASSFLMRNFKYVYYRILMFYYSWCGKAADAIATNSSWTDKHIRTLWRQDDKTTLIYPPCDTQDLMDNMPSMNH